MLYKHCLQVSYFGVLIGIVKMKTFSVESIVASLKCSITSSRQEQSYALENLVFD